MFLFRSLNHFGIIKYKMEKIKDIMLIRIIGSKPVRNILNIEFEGANALIS